MAQSDNRITNNQALPDAQYRILFELSGNAILVYEPSGKVVEANPAACALYGYSREELIGLTAPALVHPDYHYLLPEFVRTLNAGRRFHRNVVNVRKDGTPLHVEVLAARFNYQD